MSDGPARLPRLRAGVRLTAWTAALLLAGRILLALDPGTLSVPTGSFDELSGWVSNTPPADIAVALGRLAGLAAVGYLLAATALAVVAAQIRARPLAVVAEALSPGVVRRIATGGSGVGLVIGGAVASLPTPDLLPGQTDPPAALATASPDPAAPAGAGVTATMQRLSSPAATMTRLRANAGLGFGGPGATGVPGEGEATMVRVDGGQTTATMTPLPPSPGSAASAAATPAANQPATPPPTPSPGALAIDATAWVVEPGDSFWSIAEEVTGTSGATSDGERQVTQYWHRLVDANRPGLVDPDNPDLLVPGQRLMIPPPEAVAPP
jgi:nucleoid-associated protein YgaU